MISSNDRNGRCNSTLLVVPLTTRRLNSATHQFEITPTDTANKNVVAFKSILLLDFSSFVHKSEVEPANDYLGLEVFISVMEWWRWTTHAILTDFQWFFSFPFSEIKGVTKKIEWTKSLSITIESLFLRSFSHKVFMTDKREVVDLSS